MAKKNIKNKEVEKKSKGKAIYVQTTKGVYPVSILKGYEIVKEEIVEDSKQLKEYQEFITESELVEPIYSGSAFLALYESTPVFFACVQQIARDVAGLGWTLQLDDGEKENIKEREKAKQFLRNINPELPLRTLLKELMVDWGVIGYFGIEVLRNKKKEITKLYRIPAHTLWIHKSKKKFCQIRDYKKRWFRMFGSDPISSETGKPDAKGDATEVIYYKNPYPKSDYYGAPNIISAIGDVVGLVSARDYNINFFSNYGIPTAIITLTGDWDDEAEQKIQKFLSNEVKGLENAHRSLVLTQTDECKVDITPIDTEIKEGSFNIYEQARKENILIAYSMPPERIGVRVTGELGGNVAQESTKIYVSGIVDPLQLDLEEILNKILEEGLNISSYHFKFNDVDIRDTKTVTEYLTKQISSGLKSPNEARKELGLQPYEGGDAFYMLSTLLPISSETAPISEEEINGKVGDKKNDN